MQKKQVYSIFLVSVIFLIYSLPYLLLRQDAVIPSWDNLDSYFIWYKVLSNYGWFLPLDFKIPEFLDGTPRNVFHSELIFQVAIFNFLTPLKAYITVDLLGRIIGFFGMFLLLKDYILKKEAENTLLISGLAVCYAMIPNPLTLTFLTILGQPLWLWGFLNIRKGDYKYYNWLVITLIPFGVNFELITPFFLTFVGCIWLYDLITKKKWNLMFLFSIFLCTFVSLITIYRFIYISLFDQNFVSHRKDWSVVQIQILSQHSFIKSILEGFKLNLFNNGEFCANTANSLIIVPTMLFTLIYGIYKKAKSYIVQILLFTTLISLICIIYGLFFYYLPLQKFIDENPVMTQFQFSRFYFMLPMLWVFIFATSLSFIKNIFSKFGKYIVIVLILMQVVNLYSINTYFHGNIAKYILKKEYSLAKYSYKEYFAEEQYQQIKEFIGLPQDTYKVAIVGELPFNVAAYNGFHSINGYFNLYSWHHKQKLNKMNKNLIEKNPVYQMLLVYWGHQQLIYWDEYYFDTKIMKELGTKYLLSDRPIFQFKQSKLKYLKTFPPRGRFRKGFTIYLYELK